MYFTKANYKLKFAKINCNPLFIFVIICKINLGQFFIKIVFITSIFLCSNYFNFQAKLILTYILPNDAKAIT